MKKYLLYENIFSIFGKLFHNSQIHCSHNVVTYFSFEWDLIQHQGTRIRIIQIHIHNTLGNRRGMMIR